MPLVMYQAGPYRSQNQNQNPAFRFFFAKSTLIVSQKQHCNKITGSRISRPSLLGLLVVAVAVANNQMPLSLLSTMV
jgi:hypothetical protein